MKKIISLNLIAIVAAVVVFFSVQELLLGNTSLKTSISYIILKSNSLNLNMHLLVLGLLPIYIGLVVFGSAILGVYLGTNIQQFIFQRVEKFNSYSKKSSVR